MPIIVLAVLAALLCFSPLWGPADAGAMGEVVTAEQQ